ncbi:outer membrane beta-barrel protein [bacterium]|nr:outer membrane beta-barrel protein [bacterium]
MLRRLTFPALAALLLLTNALPASATMVWGLSAWGAGLGLAAPENIDSTFYLDGVLEFARVNENITLDGRLMYWSASEGEGDFKVDFSDFAILPGATYRFTPQGSVTPLARAGLGIHRFKADVNLDFGGFGSASGSATSTEFGVYAGGGAAFRAGEKFEILGIAEYHIMDANFFTIGAEVRVPLGGGGQ